MFGGTNTHWLEIRNWSSIYIDRARPSFFSLKEEEEEDGSSQSKNRL